MYRFLLCLLGMGLVFLASGPSPALPSPKNDRPMKEIEAAREALRLLKQLASDARTDPAELWKRWGQMRLHFPGSPECLEAAQILRQAPSPLDKLDRSQIAERNRTPWLPAEVVSVLGDQRGREWSNSNVAVSPDGQILVSWSSGGTHLWDPITLRERETLPLRGGVFAPRSRIFASAAGTQVQLWDLAVQPARRIARLEAPAKGPQNHFITSVVFTVDGKFLVCSTGAEIFFWDLTGEKPRLSGTIPYPETLFSVTNEKLSPDGRFLIAGNPRQGCGLWSLAPGRMPIPIQIDWPEFAFSQDGKRLVTKAFRRLLKLWDMTVDPPKLIDTFGDTPIGSSALTFSPDGELLAGRDLDGDLCVWPLSAAKRRKLNLAPGAHFVRYSFPPNYLTIAFLPDSRTVLLGGSDCRLKLFDLFAGKERFSTYGHHFAISAMTLSPDGLKLATGDYGGDIRLWNLDGKGDQDTLVLSGLGANDRSLLHSGRKPGVVSVCYSPDGTYLLSIQQRESIQLWDLLIKNPARPKHIIGSHTFMVERALFSPNNQQVVTWGLDLLTPKEKKELAPAWNRGVLRFWDWQNGALQLQHELRLDPEAEVETGMYSPDGCQFAYHLRDDAAVHLCDARRQPPTLLGPIKFPNTHIFSFVYSPQGGKLLTTSWDWEGSILDRKHLGLTLRAWDLAGAKPQEQSLQRFKGSFDERPTDPVMAPDGKTFASADLETLRVWSAQTGKLLLKRKLPGWFKVLYAPDSRHLVLGNHNGTAYIVRIAPVPVSKQP